TRRPGGCRVFDSAVLARVAVRAHLTSALSAGLHRHTFPSRIHLGRTVSDRLVHYGILSGTPRAGGGPQASVTCSPAIGGPLRPAARRGRPPPLSRHATPGPRLSAHQLGTEG